MPVLSKDNIRIDYTDEGAGPLVVLVHSSVSANRQWRSLTDALKDRYHVRAVNLFGYGETTPWPAAAPQTLYAQAQLVLAVCDAEAPGPEAPGAASAPVNLVGHSFGGAVALKAARLLGRRAASLLLFEPIPFNLIHRPDTWPAQLEVRDLVDDIKYHGALGDWPGAAERFAEYWLGDGSWAAMPEKRQAAFMTALPPVLNEIDAIGREDTALADWATLTARTMLVSDPATRLPVREVARLLAGACPGWTFRDLPGGGHMAPLTRPDLFNPLVREFLDAGG